MALRPFKGRMPVVDPSAYVDQSAQVIGDVTLGARSSVWFNSVVRGDVHWIRIGEETNVQDLCVLHVTNGKHPLSIGARVTIGHSVTLHGCTVGDLCLIGIGATILDGAEIGEGCLIAAGSLVSPGTQIPPGSLAMGTPARVKRALRPEEREALVASAANYVRYAQTYREG
jgi:carbonic anhydrase/acetyltransferase-like protein (isoleucine patch superfamily)